MLKGTYELYVNDTIKLVRSAIIKSELTARKINERLGALGVFVDSEDLGTWKYFLNLAGEYHSVDAPIYIISSDTQQSIVLTKGNLVNSPVTVIDYGPGGIYHDELLAANPRKDMLIRGIFSPVDLATAVEAEEHSLLAWDETLLAANEISLMGDTDAWIKRFMSRWNVEDYSISDPQYGSSLYAVFIHALVNSIINLRQNYVNTPEVSQFHLWSYLRGHYELDRFRQSLDINQSLWLYRNIWHIERYAGKGILLDTMLDKLARPASLRGVHYDHAHIERSLTSSLTPVNRFFKQDWEDLEYRSDEDVLVTGRSVLFESVTAALDNDREFEQDIAQLEQSGKSSLINRFPVGLVKLEQVSNTVSDLLSSAAIRISYWVYLTKLGLYSGTHRLTMPDGTAKTLTSSQMLTLFIYANNYINGTELKVAPTVRVADVVRMANPTVSDLRGHAPSYITDEDLTEALFDLVVPEVVSNAEELNYFVRKVASRRVIHDLQYNSFTGYDESSHMRDVINNIYVSVEYDISIGLTYNEWFSSIKLSPFEYGLVEWKQVLDDVLLLMTGIEAGAASMPSNQRAVVEIINSLTSYGVIVTEGDTLAGAIGLDFPFSSMIEAGTSLEYSNYVDSSKVHLLDDSTGASYKIHNEIELLPANLNIINMEPRAVHETIDIDYGVLVERHSEQYVNVGIGGTHVFDVDIVHEKS